MILNLSFCTETPCNIKRHRTRFQNGFGLIVSSEPTNNLVYVPNCLWCQVKTNMPMHVKAIWVYLSEDLHLLKCKSFFYVVIYTASFAHLTQTHHVSQKKPLLQNAPKTKIHFG